MLILTIPSYTNPTVPVRGGCLPPTLAASVRVQALTLAAHSRLPIPNRVNSSLTTRRPPPPYPFEHQCSVLSLSYFVHSSADARTRRRFPPAPVALIQQLRPCQFEYECLLPTPIECSPLTPSCSLNHSSVFPPCRIVFIRVRTLVCPPLPQVLMLVPPSHVRSSVACIILWILCSRFKKSFSLIFYHSNKKLVKSGNMESGLYPALRCKLYRCA